MDMETEQAAREFEETVLKDAILSATGLSGEQLQIGIKGDPSLRETALARPRYRSGMDERLAPVLKQLEALLLEHGTYNLFVGFNNCEVRTTSIFDPLRTEIHDGQRLADPSYVERHFPRISYPDKVAGMRELYDWMLGSRLHERLPATWHRFFTRRHSTWQPMEPEEVQTVMSTLGVLRDMPDYYLRNANINLVQGVVRVQFNCDGTQLVRSRDFEAFLAQNLP